MKRIALIHTVQSVYLSFENQLRDAFADQGEPLKIHNILDDFLAFDALPQESGVFTEKNRNRLKLDLESAAMTGADLIVTTCSQISPSVRELAPSIPTPIITIDEAMARLAVSSSKRIGLLSTASGTVEYVRETLLREAQQQREVEIQVLCDNNAILALRRGDMACHDEIVRQLAKQADACDCIIMAQASAAHMRESVRELSGIPVFIGTELCIQQVVSFFREKAEKEGLAQ